MQFGNSSQRKARLAGPYTAAALLFFLSSAKAADPEISSDDPAYLPSPGHLMSDTAFSFEQETKTNLAATLQGIGNSRPPPSDPLLTYQYKKRTADLYQSVQYAVADSYVVTIADHCSLVAERYDYRVSGNSSNLFGRNCGDPSLSGIVRALKQADSESLPVNLDIGAGFAPDLVKGSFYQPAIAAGTEVGDVNLTVSHIFDSFSLLGRAGVQVSGQARFEGGGGSEVLSAHQQLYADLTAQYRGWQDYPVTLGFRTVPPYGYTERYRYQSADSATPPIEEDAEYRVGYSFYPYIELTHPFIADRLTVSVRYQHGFEGDQKYYNQNQPGSVGGKVDRAGSDFIIVDFSVIWF
jgi:hypothetical protein